MVIVDRGFRDCVGTMEELGFNVILPPFLHGRQRFTQSDANQSRNVTKIRWVVEAVNGRMKQFKFLANTIQNGSLPHLEQYLLIICAIINRYQRPIKTSTPDDVIIADKMIRLSKQKNNFEKVSISICSKMHLQSSF